MTTFNITNIVPKIHENSMVVFYKFSNGELFSNTVPTETPVPEILAWGQSKCDWFDERMFEIERMREKFINRPIEPESLIQE